jgi:hypothetical protein
MRELELIARNLRGHDATLLRKDVALYGADLQKDLLVFTREVNLQVRKEKPETVVLLAILKD